MKQWQRWGWILVALGLGILPLGLLFAGGIGGQVRPVWAGNGVSLSITASKTETVTLGEFITYTIAYTVSPGHTLPAATLGSCLPNNDPSTEPEFLFVANSWQGPIEIGSTPPVSPVVPQGTGNCRTWSLAAINNASGEDYVYHIRYRVQVGENYVRSVRGEVGIVAATLSWDEGDTLQATAALTITTPNLSTRFYVEGPTSNLKAGDLLTMTAIFTNVAAPNVQAAYSAVVNMYLPEFVTDVIVFADTPTPDLVPVVYLGVNYIRVRWFAPGVLSMDSGEDPRLGVVAPGEAVMYRVSFRIMEDVGPGLSSTAFGFGVPYSPNPGISRFKTLPGSNTFYERFATTYPAVPLAVSPIVMALSKTGGFLESGNRIFAGAKDIITHTLIYTLPAGTTLSTPAYFQDRLADGLVYGGLVTYPTDILTGTPQFATEKIGSTYVTYVRWPFSETLILEQERAFTLVYTAFLQAHFFVGPPATNIEIPWANEFRNVMNVTYAFRGTPRSFVTHPNDDKYIVTFARPHYGDRDNTTTRARLSKCLVWDDACLDSTSSTPLPIQGGSTVVFNINYVCNGGFTTEPRFAPAVLTAYNTVITDTLPAQFEVVDAWPPNYVLTLSGNQQSVTWHENDSVLKNHCLPGVVYATNKSQAPVFVITATVPLSVQLGVQHINQVSLEYQDVVGSLYRDQSAQLFMIVDLSVQKWAEGVRGPYVRIGEALTYTIVDTVPPRGIAYWPMQEDRLPPGVYYIPDTFQVEGATLMEPLSVQVFTPTGASPQQMLVWRMQTLDNLTSDAYAHVTITYQARVTGLYADGTPYANSISLMESDVALRSSTRLYWRSKNEPGPPYEFSSQPAQGIAYLQQPCFNVNIPGRAYYKTILTTTSGTGAVSAGDYVGYYLYIRNTGSGDAHEVRIQDMLPPGLELVSYSAAIYDTSGQPYTITLLQEPQPGDWDLIWEVAKIPGRPGSSPVISWGSLALNYIARVSDSIGAGATLSNAMRVLDFSSMPGVVPDERYYGNLYAHIVKYAGPLTVVAGALEKEAPAGRERLQTLVYTLTAPSPPIRAALHNVIITDVLHPSLHPVTASVTTVAPGVAFALDGQVFTLTLPYLDRDEQITAIITTTIHPTAATQIPNHATLSWTNQPVGGQRIEVSAQATTQVLDPDLVLTKSSLSPIPPGEVFTYSLVYANAGMALARQVVLTDVFPPEIEYVGYAAVQRPVTLTSEAPLTWELGDLPPGAGDTIYITATVPLTLPVGTTIYNSAAISTISLGDLPENNHAAESTLITRTTVLTLSQHPATTVVVPGDLLAYTLHYTITGVEQAQGLEIIGAYRPEFEFVDASPPPVGNPANGTLNWDLGTLEPGLSGSVHFTLSLTSPLTNGLRLTNITTLDAINARPVSVGVPVTVSSASAITITKLASADKVRPGEGLTYTLLYTSTGTDYARSVRITETYGAHFQVLSAWPPFDSGNNVWELGTLGHVTGTIIITGQIRADAPFPYVSTNLVTLGADNSAPVDAEADTLISDNLLRVSASAPLTVTPGEQLVYTLVYTADGSEPSYGVVLRNHHSAHLSIEATDPPLPPFPGTEVRWELGNLPFGTTDTVLITATVKAPLQNGLVLENLTSLEALDTLYAQRTVATVVSSAPELALHKTVSAEVVEPGDVLVYTITYTNTGTDYAYNAVITETYGDYIDVLAATPPPDNGLNVWTLGNLGQTSGTLVITGQVRLDAPFPHRSANHVTLSASNAAPLTATAAVTISDNFVALEVAAPTFVAAGDLVTYTLVYTAGGSRPSHAVTVRNTLPAHVTLEATLPPPTEQQSDTLIWQLGSLDEGTTEVLTVTVRVTQPLTNGTELLNTAVITALNTPGVQQIVTTTVNSGPLLALDKVASAGRVQPGDTLIYTITYANTGNDVAHNVVLTETYGEYVDFVTAAPFPNAGNNVWNLGVLGQMSGQIVITMTVAEDAPFPALTLNRVDLTAANAAPLTATVAVSISKPVMQLTASAPPLVDAGGLLTYTLVYTAAGTEDAPGAVLRSLPTPYGVLAATLPPGTLDGATLVWELGDLALGMTGTVEVGVWITSPLTNGVVLENTGELTAQGAVPDTAAVTTTVLSAPALTLDKVASAGQVQPGATLIYTITYANTGNDVAHNVVLTETYGDYVEFVTAAPFPNAGNNVWHLGVLGQTNGQIVITMTVAEDAPFPALTLNRVDLTAANAGALLATAETEISKNLLHLTASAPPVVEAGTVLTYTLHYTAAGTEASLGAVLRSNPTPEGVVVGAFPMYAARDGATLLWELGDLPLGATGAVQVGVLITSPLTDRVVLTNTGIITAQGTYPDEAVVTTTVSSAPTLLLDKVVSTAVAPPGSTLVYTITYANLGNGYAQEVVLTETYGEYVDFVTADPFPHAGNNVWHLGVLGQTSGQVVITLTVAEEAPYQSWLTNRVTLTAAGGWQVTDAAATQVLEGVLLLTQQTPPWVDAGDLLTYTLFYTATGARASAGVVLTAAYPVETAFVSALPAPEADGRTWNLGQLAPGDTGEVQVSLRVTAPLTNGWLLTHTAGITSTNALPATTSGSSEVHSAPHLTLTLHASRAEILPGEYLVYTATYANLGNDYAHNANLVLTYDPALDFVSATPPPHAGSATWIFGRLGQEQGSVVITLTMLADSQASAVTTSGVFAATNATPASASVTLPAGKRLIFLPLVLREQSNAGGLVYLTRAR